MVPKQEPPEIESGWDDLARARSGNQEAWRLLFEQYSPSLLRMATLMTGSADAARDCVQETFVRVLSSVVSHQRGSLRAYLSTIVYRLALQEIQRQNRRASANAIEPPSTDPSPLDETLADERQREVMRVLRSLTDHHRDILILRLYGNHSYEEIAEITGVSVGTVKSRMFHAVKSARIRLKSRGML